MQQFTNNIILVMDFYKSLAIASPFISAFLAGLLTHFLTLKTKRFDILYENKIPAFKERTLKLIEFRKFCDGRVAFLEGNEYSPYYDENVGALHHRTEIANITDLNYIFISTSSRKKIYNLLNELSILCNVEVAILADTHTPQLEDEYIRVSSLAENCIVALYTELNLPS